MFLIGLNREADTGTAHLAVIEKRLKRLKRHYRLVETAQWPAGTSGDTLGKALFRYHTDGQWTVRRKVFSQDRRPPRSVKTPPRMVVRFQETPDGRADAGFIDDLRQRELALEGIAVTDRPGWRREDFDKLRLGHNYFVPGRDLRACFHRVCDQGRLSTASVGTPSDAAPPDRSDTAPWGPPSGDAPLTGPWLAVALPLWLSETVRKIKRYGDAP
jgi:hypothetical protein